MRNEFIGTARPSNSIGPTVISTPSTYHYRKAMAQQEIGGDKWKVFRNVIKWYDGAVEAEIFEHGLPSKHRAVRLTKLLNMCLGE